MKGYDPSKDKRFNGTMKLPNPAKGALKVCMLGTEKDVEKAREIGMDAMTEDDLKKLNKNKKLVKKLGSGNRCNWKLVSDGDDWNTSMKSLQQKGLKPSTLLGSKGMPLTNMSKKASARKGTKLGIT